ncbi:hypothetical protein K438DRAFT_1947082 [Mycena galopus ATCC 62051]|nr:hypothetical protein K438DRAFT_1947082 [Mycena galopus ATCC 62051]
MTQSHSSAMQENGHKRRGETGLRSLQQEDGGQEIDWRSWIHQAECDLGVKIEAKAKSVGPGVGICAGRVPRFMASLCRDGPVDLVYFVGMLYRANHPPNRKCLSPLTPDPLRKRSKNSYRRLSHGLRPHFPVTSVTALVWGDITLFPHPPRAHRLRVAAFRLPPHEVHLPPRHLPRLGPAARRRRPHARPLAHFFRGCLTFARHLASLSHSQSALIQSRYSRRMGMALSQMLCATFVNVANMWFTISPPSVHSGFSPLPVPVHPALIHPSGTVGLDALLLNGAHLRGALLRVLCVRANQTPVPVGSVVRVAKPSATDVDFKDIPLSPSSFTTQTDADTATELDGYSFDTFSTHKVSFSSS